MSALDTIRSMDGKDFEKLALRIAKELGFEVRGTKVTENSIELDSTMKLPTGKSLHYLFIVSRSDISRDFLKETLERVNNPFVKILVMSAGDVEDEALSFADRNGIEVSPWDEFLQFLDKYGILAELEKEEPKDEAFLPSLGEVQSMEAWAKNFMEEGEYRKALEYIENGLKIKDSYEPLVRLKAEALEKMGREREAEDWYRRATALNENDAAAWVSLALLLEKRGDFEGALSSMDRLTVLMPDSYQAWMEKGELLYRMGKYDEALLCFNKATQISQTGKEAWNNRGLVLKHMGRFEEATDSFNRALAIDPVFWDALINKALLLHERGMYPQAIDVYTYMLRIREDPLVICQRGIAYSEWGEKEDAISDFRRALELRPDLRVCENELNNLVGSGEDIHSIPETEENEPAEPEENADISGALAAFVGAAEMKKLMENPPSEPEEEEKPAQEEEVEEEEEIEETEPAEEVEVEERDEAETEPKILSGISSLSQLMTRGELYFKLGMLKEALSCYEELLEAKPASHELLNAYASILYLLGRKKEAMEAVKRSLDIEKDSMNARMNLLQMQVDSGSMPRALDMMNSILRERPDASLWIRRGKLLEEMGREGASVQSYEKALEISSSMIRVWNALGISYHRIGEDEDALESLEEGISVDERDWLLWNNYGAIQYMMERDEDAIESFERGLGEDMDVSPLHNNLGVALARKGDEPGARDRFSIALEKDESAAYAYNNMKYL